MTFSFTNHNMQDMVRAFSELFMTASIATILAFVMGLPLGMYMYHQSHGSSHKNEAVFRVVHQLYKGMTGTPTVVLVVLLFAVAQLLFQWGSTPLQAAMIVAICATFSFAKFVYEALQAIPAELQRAAYALGMRPLHVVKDVLLVEVTPFIMAHMVTTFRFSIIASVVMGLVGAGGIGTLLVNATVITPNIAVVFVTAIILVIVTVVLQIATVRVEKAMLKG